MSDPNSAMTARYRGHFLREVEAMVERGETVRMCMQCGVCAGSCPLGKHWTHPPQKLFMMIRAGKREEVLTSDSMWMCTSCYNCIVRCPRGVEITHVMHGLAHYAQRLGLVPEGQPTAHFARLFWDNLMKRGRINELKLGVSLYFKDGLNQGVKNAWGKRQLGQAMMKRGRMQAGELFGGHRVADIDGLRKIIEKAEAIEAARFSTSEQAGREQQ